MIGNAKFELRHTVGSKHFFPLILVYAKNVWLLDKSEKRVGVIDSLPCPASSGSPLCLGFWIFRHGFFFKRYCFKGLYYLKKHQIGEICSELPRRDTMKESRRLLMPLSILLILLSPLIRFFFILPRRFELYRRKEVIKQDVVCEIDR